MQFEYDPERLIEEVKKRPGIWDFECLDYRAKNTRQKLWAEVVKELNQNTNNVTKSELRELELQLQRKWKSIRDCFQKYVSNPSRTKRPYIYSRKLQFLLKEQSLPTPEAGSSDSEDGSKNKMKWKKTQTMKMTYSDDEEDEEAHDDLPNVSDSCDNDYDDANGPTPAKQRKCKKSLSQFAFANVDAPSSKSDDSDPEKLFLLSLVPHLKSVPEELRLNAKMELMQVLQNANYNATKDHKFI